MVETVKKWILPVCVILCGTFLSKSAYDQALTSRHLIWCVATILIVLCTKTAKVNYFALGYIAFVLLSGLCATNKSEWIYAALRAILFVTFLSVVKIDKKLLAKTMIVLGVAFSFYFWYNHDDGHRGLMRMKNFWAAAHFFVIPFCLYAISQKFWRNISIVVIVSMVVNIFIMNTRSAILALVVAMVSILIINRKDLYYVAAALLVGVTACIALKVFDNYNSLSYRIAQWGPTLCMIKENIFGVGAGNWWVVFPKYVRGMAYPEALNSVSFRHPHNDYLWIASESGIGALICYLGMFASALYYSYKEKASWLLFGITGYMVIAFFSASHERAFASLILALFFAVSLNGREIKHRNIIIPVLIFAMVVFGFRYRSSCWNKKLRATTTWHEIINCCEGYSVFSTLTHTGLPYHWWEGISHLKLNNTKEAIEDFQIAYRYNPYNIHVINGYGISKVLQGRKEEARKHFEYSLKICPDFEDVQLNLEKLEKMK